MKWSKILFIIVLDFAVLKYGSTQSLLTGYTYNTEDNDLNVDRTDDLICGYLFSGLTQMRLINLVFSPPVSLSSKALGMIHHLNGYVTYMISSLYWLAPTKISTLWLLQLYTKMLLSYFDNILKKSLTDFEHNAPKIKDTHMYVIGKMQIAAGNCRENNAYDPESKYVTNTGMTYEDISVLVINNSRILMQMMTSNSTMSNLQIERLGETMRPKRLLLNNLGVNAELKNQLMTRYDVQVYWGDTSDRLEEAWLNAHDMDWSTNNLRNFLAYYTLHTDFLKLIMYRLIMKQLMGLEKIKVGPYHLLIALEHFQNKLNIINDQQINELKVAFDKYGKSRSDKDQCLMFILSYLQVELQKICETLGCHLIEPIPVNANELTKPGKCTNGHEEIYVQCLVSEVRTVKIDVDYFLEHLNHIFAYVSFEAIQLIIKYIGEINQ